jgi:putative ABC transport system permease protein
MIANYLTVALRNLVRHKLYSFINIAGLTVGFICAIFIVLYLRDELSYDAWIPDSQDIYRVESVTTFPGRDPHFLPEMAFPVTVAMQAEIPEVVAQTHLIPETMTAKVGDRLFRVSIDTVDANFFQMIKLPLVAGDPARVLAQPDSIVLSETMARRFFGNADPLGKTVTVGDAHPLVVTGILRDLPHNTHLSVDLVMPNTSKADIDPLDAKKDWLTEFGWGYVKLAPGTDPARVLAKLKAITDKYIDVKKEMNLNVPGSDVLHLHLIPFRRVHLAPYGETVSGSWTRIYGFAAIAALILLIACFNFMNLATARATMRAREISLRKVVGATRWQLIVQFLGESVITTLVALLLALALVEVLLPVYDSFLNRPIHFDYLRDWPLTSGILLVAIGAGLLGGLYPALILSGFRPAATLGTGATRAGGSGLLRMTLVGLQFAISIGLGIATIVVFAQLRHARQVDPGFDRHNVVVISGTRNLLPSVRQSLANALAADPAIAGAAASQLVPFDGGSLVDEIELPQTALKGAQRKLVVRDVSIDPNFLRVYGIRLLAGRNFSRARGQDVFPGNDARDANRGGNILITAAAARLFGYTAQGAVGQSILFGARKIRVTIVGVVGDANYDGLYTAVPPVIYFYDPKIFWRLSVRARPGNMQAALTAIDRIWHQFAPTIAVHREFQEESFDRLFTDDEKEGAIFGIFVGVAIFIACLGLFGLAAFSTERRTREIGLRKTFGASTSEIIWMLLGQFSVPVLVANLIAWPVAWYYLHNWLQGFAYRISLSPIYFLGAGASTLVIAWATVFVHARRVANSNPIHALRYE